MKNPFHIIINPYSKLSDKVVMAVVLINSIIIFLDASGFRTRWLILTDIVCSLFFVGEMLLKINYDKSIKKYWKKRWNRFDGTLVILSLPSIIAFFFPSVGISYFVSLRLLRALRFLRVLDFFRSKKEALVIFGNFKKALRQSLVLFVCYFIVILIFAMLSTSLFGHTAPQYFGTVTESIYSIFRLFTIEGWYEIPDAVANDYGAWGIFFIRLYFIFLLMLGGVIGLSLINSVFVRVMLNNNDEVLIKKVNRLERKIDKLMRMKEIQTVDLCEEREQTDDQ